MLRPDWDAPARVRAFVTTREFGDLKSADARRRLRALVPAEPAWLKQVHAKRVIDLDADAAREGDAAITRKPGVVCVAQAADCMPVLFADVDGATVAAAHAGWRGLEPPNEGSPRSCNRSRWSLVSHVPGIDRSRPC